MTKKSDRQRKGDIWNRSSIPEKIESSIQANRFYLKPSKETHIISLYLYPINGRLSRIPIIYLHCPSVVEFLMHFD